MVDLPYRPCVGIVLAHPDGRVFVGERIEMADAWQMPQGGIDEGEDPQSAALRELEEEVGVGPDLVTIEAETAGWVFYDLPSERVGTAFKGQFRGQKQKWFLMRFLGQDADIRIDTAHPEFSDWDWRSAEEVLSGIVAFKRGVYDEVFAELRPLL